MRTVEPNTLKSIRLLLTDIDGVLTDGRIQFDGEGRELKTFHVHDAAGLFYWHRSGGMSGFLSGRRAPIIERRAAEWGIHEVHLGHLSKIEPFEEMLERLDLDAEQVAYIGDDLLDLAVLSRVGFAAAPRNARPEVRERVHMITSVDGGFGVLREVIEALLRARGDWDQVVAKGGLP